MLTYLIFTPTLLKQLQANVEQDGILIPFIPKFAIPLNSSECMCNSLMEYANVFRDKVPLHPDNVSCAVNSKCDGVRCEVQFAYGTYYDEFVILPCTTPPAMEYLLETPDYTPLLQLIFDDNGTYTVDSEYVANLTHVVKSFIERGPRSISAEVC